MLLYFSIVSVASISPLKMIIILVLLIAFTHSMNFRTSKSLYSVSSQKLLSVSILLCIINIFSRMVIAYHIDVISRVWCTSGLLFPKLTLNLTLKMLLIQQFVHMPLNLEINTYDLFPSYLNHLKQFLSLYKEL